MSVSRHLSCRVATTGPVVQGAKQSLLEEDDGEDASEEEPFDSDTGEDASSGGDSSSDGDGGADGDDGGETAFERKAKRRDAAAARERALADEEAADMLDAHVDEARSCGHRCTLAPTCPRSVEREPVVLQGERYELPDEDEEAAAGALATDLSVVKRRIAELLRVLDNFAALRDPARSRGDYVAQLKRDCAAYYGYNAFMVNALFNLFAPMEAAELLEANEVRRPMTLRANTLKTRRRELAAALIDRGANVDPVGKWTKVGLVVYESTVPIGATPEYMAGHYMRQVRRRSAPFASRLFAKAPRPPTSCASVRCRLPLGTTASVRVQGASSFLPCLALAPQPKETVVDMAAAPGGKTTYLAAMMRNTGCIFANELNKERLKSVQGNLQRMGVTNTIVCNYDGKDLPKARPRGPPYLESMWGLAGASVYLRSPLTCPGHGLAVQEHATVCRSWARAARTARCWTRRAAARASSRRTRAPRRARARRISGSSRTCRSSSSSRPSTSSTRTARRAATSRTARAASWWRRTRTS